MDVSILQHVNVFDIDRKVWAKIEEDDLLEKLIFKKFI